MNDDTFAWGSLPTVAVAPDQVVSVNLTNPTPLWVVVAPEQASGAIELVVLTPGGSEIARMTPGVTAFPRLAFDLSALDTSQPLQFELRSDDICVLPPVQVAIDDLRSHAVAGDLPTDLAFAPESIVRSPA